MKESHSLRGFAKLVAAMRESQRRHDRTSNEFTRAAKCDFELRVDAALREILSPTLFGAEDET